MRKFATIAVILVVVAGAATAGWVIWQKRLSDRLPAGIATSNGRVEATEVEIATKLAGRVIEITPREGDTVENGTVVARLDATELEHQLHQAKAQAEQARQSLAAARAAIENRKSELTFAQQEFQRVSVLARKGFAPNERLDQRQQQLAGATAALRAAEAQAGEAGAAIAAADASVDHMQSLLTETEIKSPIRGRVQYRLVEPGSVLAAGSRILTLLDLSDVSMTIFLPAQDAGRLVIGDEARVVLDAAPDYVFPTKVVFVSPEAQFTPKTVETAAEREKLMFRVKLQAPQDVLKKMEGRVMSGLRGVAYVRTDRSAQWPDRLAIKLPER
ncbi:MAG: HlyD family efflux transporter periplasmic adaptor subunit [Rhizobiales bacterium]|nr:HlyD family efflux transporter periplasmic adaptor subunit [Hyphomicrobiales bacterium]